ncbi:MAG: wax ester/triacylglycerol synthase family O-acyltransferase [Alphaproteobacteria bacterium]
MEKLSISDSLFLYAEKDDTPLHVGTLAIVELPDDFEGSFRDKFVEMFDGRIDEVPMLRWKAVAQPLNLGYPVWVEQEEMDWDYHVRRTSIPMPGNMEQLITKIEKLHMQKLDRNHPLHMHYVFEGLEGNRAAVYSKIHHSCIDGQTAVKLATIMFDLTPEPRAPLTQEQRAEAGLNRTADKKAPGLLSAITNAAIERIEKPLYSQIPSLVRMANKMISAPATKPAKTEPIETEDGVDFKMGMAWGPKSILNTHLSNDRKIAFGSVPLELVKNTRRAANTALDGVTLNDVIVAACGGALRAYLEEKDALPEQSLVCGAPVAMKQKDGSNNNVSYMMMHFRTDIADPMERLAKVAASSKKAKAGQKNNESAMEGADLNMPSYMVEPLAKLATSKAGFGMVPMPMAAVLSNVPGPQMQLYMAGAKIVEAYPISVLFHNAGLNITVQSFMDRFDFSITTCRATMPDAERFVELIEGELRLMADLFGADKVDGADDSASTLKFQPANMNVA